MRPIPIKPAQAKALLALQKHGPAAASDLGIRTTTLMALEGKGLVAHYASGLGMPQRWRLTSTGQAWVEAHPHG